MLLDVSWILYSIRVQRLQLVVIESYLSYLLVFSYFRGLLLLQGASKMLRTGRPFYLLWGARQVQPKTLWTLCWRHLWRAWLDCLFLNLIFHFHFTEHFRFDHSMGCYFVTTIWPWSVRSRPFLPGLASEQLLCLYHVAEFTHHTYFCKVWLGSEQSALLPAFVCLFLIIFSIA